METEQMAPLDKFFDMLGRTTGKWYLTPSRSLRVDGGPGRNYCPLTRAALELRDYDVGVNDYNGAAGSLDIGLAGDDIANIVTAADGLFAKTNPVRHRLLAVTIDRQKHEAEEMDQFVELLSQTSDAWVVGDKDAPGIRHRLRAVDPRSGRCYCPLTSVAKDFTGDEYSTGEYGRAALDLKRRGVVELTSHQVGAIIAAADCSIAMDTEARALRERFLAVTIGRQKPGGSTLPSLWARMKARWFGAKS